MKKWLLIFLFFSVFVSVSVYASSSSGTIFSISGCDFDGGVHLGNEVCAGASEGIYEGLYYCDTKSSGYSWITTDSGLGCTRGASTLPSKLTPQNTCCPNYYVCESDGPTNFKCNPSSCTFNMSKTDCEAVGVFYYDTGNAGTSYCACEGMECSDYVNEENCTDDKGYAVSGDNSSIYDEFECAGSYYVVNAKKCIWNATCREEVVNIKQNTNNPENWSCSVGFEIGVCDDGIQLLNWSITEDFTNAPNASSWSSAEKEQCLLGAGCAPGRDTRACGKELVKLPGFGLFELVFSLVIIALFHFGIGRFKYRKLYY